MTDSQQASEGEEINLQSRLHFCSSVSVDARQPIVSFEDDRKDEVRVVEEGNQVQERLLFQDSLDGEKRSKTDDTYHELGGTECPLKNVTSELHLEQRALHIRRKTKEFEAEHRECNRVLPYKDDSGQVYVHLYVYSGKNGISEDLKAAAQECFGKMDVEIKWFDLYNNAATVLNVTSVNYPSGKSKTLKKSEVDKISKVIDENLSELSRHRNITALQPSFKVSDSKETNDPCIMVYVLGKGHIPIGESEIPRFIGSYPVDIVNGFWVETIHPFKPNDAQKQWNYLRFGASIGVKGENASGTLGAIVKDENGGPLYLLSCDHVIKHTEKSEIIHPGLDHHLNSVNYYLDNYRKLTTRITGLETNFSPNSLEEHEKFEKYTELKTVLAEYLDRNSNRVSDQDIRKLDKYEKELENLLLNPPRCVANYTTGVQENIKWSDDKEYFIDAAIAELSEDDTKRLKERGKAEIIDTEDYPNGECTPATRIDRMDTEVLIKSGSASGYTSSDHLVGAAAAPPAFMKLPEFEAHEALVSKKEKSYFCEQCAESRLSPFDEDEMKLAQSTCVRCKCSIESPKANQCEERWLKNCLCIQTGTHPFAQDGDSGSVIFKKPNESEPRLPGFGILFGLFYSGYMQYVLASPLQISLETLSKKVSTTCKLKVVSSYE